MSLLTARDRIASRFPFFYGWAMLPMATIALMATSPGQTYGISVFYSSFQESLGLSNTEISGAYMLGTLLGCLPLTLVGTLMDRHGIRRMMFVVVLLFGSTVMAASQAGGLIGLFLAFLGLRMLGQGALSLLAHNTLAMWFNRRLGTANGIMSLGSGLALATAAPLFLVLIEWLGWRGAFIFLGAAVLAVLLPMLVLFYRDRPEQIGQTPDGLPESAPPADGDPSGEADFTLRQTVRTRAYWIIMAMTALWSMSGTGVMFNLIPLCEFHGIGKFQAAGTITTLAVCLMSMQFLGGILVDRIRANGLLAVSMSAFALAFALLIHPTGLGMIHGYAALMGLATGLLSAVNHTLLARFYGRGHIGKIRGSHWTVAVAASSIGPFLLGFARDRLGGYHQVLLAISILFLPLILLSFFVTRPVRES